MSRYEVTLLAHEGVAERTLAFRFRKPSAFAFSAGQFVELAITDPSASQARALKHTFSIASAPREAEIVIATRMRNSAFKRVLGALPSGSNAELEGPFGSFILHDNPERPAVFIAGGIGITPFRSMLRDQEAKTRRPAILLIYSNPRPEDAAFLPELEALGAQDPRVTLLATMTRIEDSSLSWSGETGRLTSDRLASMCRQLAAPIYYVAGPPAMVGATRDMLESTGAGDDDIRSEEFFGY